MEPILFLIILAVFIIGMFAFKLPISVSMLVACIATLLVSLVTGHISLTPIEFLRNLIEGNFAFVDTILIISTAMIFMKVVSESGALEAINAAIIKRFYKVPAVLLILLMFIIMLPGMITGSSTASVLTTGSLVAPLLLLIGLPIEVAGAFIAVGGILGLAAPPINLPVMILGGGIDMPYAGFTIPLLALTIPLAIFSSLFLGLKHVKKIDIEEIKKEMDLDKKVKPIVFLPILVVVVLIALTQLLAKQGFPNLGMSLIFIIGAIVGIFTSKNIKFFNVSKDAVNTTLPVMGLLMVVGTLIQTMTLTGVRGFIVSSVLKLPTVARYIAISLALPLFGSISAFASASVIGVPFMFADMGSNQIMIATGISIMAAVGDLIPPAALAGIFAAKVLGMDSYMPILKKCIPVAIVFVLWGLMFIVFANQLAKFLVFI